MFSDPFFSNFQVSIMCSAVKYRLADCRSFLEEVIVVHHGRQPEYVDDSGNPHFRCWECGRDGTLYVLPPGKNFKNRWRCSACRAFGDLADVLHMHGPDSTLAECLQEAASLEKADLQMRADPYRLGLEQFPPQRLCFPEIQCGPRG